MELYINNNWTECYGNSYIAEAIAWSDRSNHAKLGFSETHLFPPSGATGGVK